MKIWLHHILSTLIPIKRSALAAKAQQKQSVSQPIQPHITSSTPPQPIQPIDHKEQPTASSPSPSRARFTTASRRRGAVSNAPPLVKSKISTKKKEIDDDKPIPWRTSPKVSSPAQPPSSRPWQGGTPPEGGNGWRSSVSSGNDMGRKDKGRTITVGADRKGEGEFVFDTFMEKTRNSTPTFSRFFFEFF